MKQDIVRHLRETFPVPLSDDDLAALLADFMASFSACADSLRSLPSPTDFLAIRRVTHTLKGFSENVGATDLSSLATALNTAAKATDSSVCSVYIAEILALYERYLQEADSP